MVTMHATRCPVRKKRDPSEGKKMADNKNVTIGVPGTEQSQNVMVEDGDEPGDIIGEIADNPHDKELRRGDGDPFHAEDNVAEVVDDGEALFVTTEMDVA